MRNTASSVQFGLLFAASQVETKPEAKEATAAAGTEIQGAKAKAPSAVVAIDSIGFASTEEESSSGGKGKAEEDSFSKYDSMTYTNQASAERTSHQVKSHVMLQAEFNDLCFGPLKHRIEDFEPLPFCIDNDPCFSDDFANFIEGAIQLIER